MSEHDVKLAWQAMTEGADSCPKSMDPVIWQSWRRSREAGVDPRRFDSSSVLSEQELDQYLNLRELEEDYGDIVSVLKQIAKNMDLTFTIFDSGCQLERILAMPAVALEDAVKNKIVKDGSEQGIGTNAVSLALSENRPIQLFHTQHYNQDLHRAVCSAAPLHNVHGKVKGAINISSYSMEQSLVELGLVSSIAKYLDGCLLENYMKRNLTFCDFSLNETVEYMPNGVIFYNSENESLNYNRKLVRMFGFGKKTSADEVETALRETLSRILAEKGDRDCSNEEWVLNPSGRSASFIVSSQKIEDTKKNKIGEMIVFQDTQEIMKLQSSIKGNQAVYTFGHIIGSDEKLMSVKEMAQRVAGYASNVLIHGESGTGKEMFAQAIHNASRRNDRPFIAINSGAIPSELIESELFGYEPGAFSGAVKGGKIGKLELASGGTLFLDEIESMPLNVQIKLLRALSTQRLTRIGGLESIPFDVRVISATKKNLLKESDLGNFREDLYYRLNIVTIELPPLRDRKEDIPALVGEFVDYFAERFELPSKSIDPHVFEILSYYYWRGNVRELRNVIERALMMLGDDQTLSPRHLPAWIVSAFQYKSLKAEISERVEDPEHGGQNLLKLGEEIIIEKTLLAERGNLKRVAEKLGISRPTLYKKINESDKLRRCKENLQYKNV